MAEVSFKAVDIVFGDEPEAALALLDQGAGRAKILEQTGQVLGVAGATMGIEAGEICVLMGLSGSGKSTLLRCVNGLNRASRGEVLVNDGAGVVDVGRCDAATLRHLRTRRIAMVFQQFALLPWRTVAENIGFGLEIRGMKRDQRDRVVQEMLRMVSLDQWQNKYAHELSGGMQQRVGLARAFATDADILLMDEPFSALDPLIRSRLQNELLDLQQKLKKTIVFVSHDLDEAIKLGTHIAIMEEGRIVQYGTPEAIVLEPANRYVADFVAHMNPLNVLRGYSLMTPLGDSTDGDGLVPLGGDGRSRLQLDREGAPVAVIAGGRSRPVTPWTDGTPIGEILKNAVVTAPADITLKTALELRHQTGNAVLLTDRGRVIGLVGDDEIYRGILRQTTQAEADSPLPPE
jgi:glycine betaine/proline transport system ATP-binding protein